MGTGRLSQRLATPAYRLAERVTWLIPEPAVPAVARVTGAVGWATLPQRRALVARHLRRVAGGDVPAPQLRRRVRAAFVSYARYWLDTFRVPVVDRDDLDRRARIEGLELVDAALARGRGAVIALPHLGSWDQAAAWLTHRDYPLTVVMERLRPPELLEWFLEGRRRTGIAVVVRGEGVWDRLEAALADNRLVGLVCDRDLSGRGVLVRFFGEDTTLPPGPARLARQCDSPLLPVGIYTGADRTWRAEIRPAVPVEHTAEESADVAAATQVLAGELEELIRRDPAQWHLMQPNWLSDREPDGATGRGDGADGGGDAGRGG